jgi:beta-mannanase
MDGFWYPWGGIANGNTPRDFVRAWRHVHDVFTKEGAANVTWVWSVNALSVPQTRQNSIGNYWPGGRYVDWIGISGFNWGTSSSFGTWMSFGQIYDDRMRSLRPYRRKPIVLTEIGAAEVGGDKAAWIRTTFASIQRSYPRIRAFVWYDKRDTKLRDWRIGSSPAATRAFARVVAGGRIASAPAALTSTR